MFDCPVCAAQYQIEVPDFCTICGWELSSLPNLSDESINHLLAQKELIRVYWAQQIWEYYTRIFAENQIYKTTNKSKKNSKKQSKKKLYLRLNELENKGNQAAIELANLLSKLDGVISLLELKEEAISQTLVSLENTIASFSQPTPSLSESGIDYKPLMQLLSKEKWRNADETTWEIILQLAWRKEEGSLSLDDINNLPVTDIRTINQLWEYYSHGRFGLNIQQRIWQEVNYEYMDFCARVGWLDKDNNWQYYEELRFSGKAPEGNLPILAWRRRACYGVSQHKAADNFAAWMFKFYSCQEGNP
jgi:hypothetical protein